MTNDSNKDLAQLRHHLSDVAGALRRLTVLAGPLKAEVQKLRDAMRSSPLEDDELLIGAVLDIVASVFEDKLPKDFLAGAVTGVGIMMFKRLGVSQQKVEGVVRECWSTFEHVIETADRETALATALGDAAELKGPMFVAQTDDKVRDLITTRTGVPPECWRCPCGEGGCDTRVFYGRAGDGKIWFMANTTFSPDGGHLYAIGNVEDFEKMMSDAGIHPKDRILFGYWLKAGLRDVLLNAPTCA